MVAVVLAGAAPAAGQSNSYTFVKVNVPGSTYTEATGVNNSGAVAGTYADAKGFVHGFVYSAGAYTTIDYPGALYTYVFGINAAGQLTGGYSLTNPLGPYHGFIYQNGVFTEFDYPLNETDGRGINNLGQVVGIYNAGYGTPDHGFVKDGGTYTSLDFPGAPKTYTFGINDYGVITGTWVDALNRLRGYWYFNGIFNSLNYPGALQTYAGGINNSHVITGWSQQGTLKSSYVVTSLASFRSFTVPFAGATASLARAINDSGQVVGSYQSPECARGCGFLATPNPAALPACTQSVSLAYANNTLTMNFTIGAPTATTWNKYLYVNNVPYLLWSAALPPIAPAVSTSIPISLAPVGRVVALSTLSTSTGGVICADYAVINTTPGGTP
ncbi:MAG TPA: hypothetical protein VFK57_06420 [Vicinamibacterales bacterium]|nr:hypothetical protein [Vicinamibacterales bacterium]